MKRELALVVSAVLVLGTHAIAQAPSPPLAFVNVHVVSMDSDTVVPGQTVIVQGERIVSIGGSNVPAGARVVDGTGHYLVPGLIDSHVHLTTDMPWAPARPDFGDGLLYLSHGVTTVMNLRGSATQIEWKRRVETGELLGPNIYTAGEFVNEPRVTTAEEVEQEITAQARAGYDLIKFHEILSGEPGRSTRQGLSRESYLRMFDAARREGVTVVGHAPVNLGLDALVASSGGAVAHIGELVRLVRPPLWVLLLDLLAATVLLLIVVGWAMAALLRRWRGVSWMSRPLVRAKALTSMVLIAYLTAFVVGSIAGPGGQFFDSTIWRFGFVIVTCALVLVSLLAAIAGVAVWRHRAIPRTSRLSLLLSAAAGLTVIYTSTVHSLPFAWKNSDSGMAHLAARLRDAGISVQTTLVVYEGFEGEKTMSRVLADPAFSMLMPETQSLWRRVAQRPDPGVLMRLVEIPPRYAEFTQTIAGSLHIGGVTLLAGTDAMGSPMIVPGSSLLRELQLLRQAGLTPYEAIRTATANPANFLGKEKEFGTIAIGKRADLLLLERNPFEDLSAFSQPVGVMVRGNWLPRERIRDLLAALKGSP